MDYPQVNGTIENNFLDDAGELRKCICEAVQMINLDCPFKVSPVEIAQKTALWHKLLRSVKDEQIVKATDRWLESGSRNFPTIGEFKSLCFTKKRSEDFIRIPDTRTPEEKAEKRKDNMRRYQSLLKQLSNSGIFGKEGMSK